MAPDWTMILEYLKVLLSGPPVAAAVSVVLIGTYSKEIRALIGRVKSAKFLGAEITASQLQISDKSEIASLPDPEAFPSEPRLPLEGSAGSVMSEALASQLSAARIWEYKYLNFFFARSTQYTLNWFYSIGSTMTVDAVDAHIATVITLADERRAIIQALESHNIVSINNGLISPTDKGREYHSWPGRAVLSSPPIASPST